MSDELKTSPNKFVPHGKYWFDVINEVKKKTKKTEVEKITSDLKTVAFTVASIEKRKPLSSSARRAGWVGCNILLDQIPEIGRISYVKNGMFAQSASVMNAWKKTAFLAESKSMESRGWAIDVLRCVERIHQAEFSLEQMYQFEAELAKRYPNNFFVKDKIRQQLQILRNRGYLRFVERGKYQLG